MAKIERLEKLMDLSIIDKYAARYGKFPKEVMAERFDNVLPFLLLWKEQAEYQERHRNAERDLSPQKPN